MRTRIVLFSHDSAGLGHIRRNLALAHALSAGTDGSVTGLLVAGRPEATRFRPPRGWDWLILPGDPPRRGCVRLARARPRSRDVDRDARWRVPRGPLRRSRPISSSSTGTRSASAASSRTGCARCAPRTPSAGWFSAFATCSMHRESSAGRVERARRGGADPHALRRDLGLRRPPRARSDDIGRAAGIASRPCLAHRLPR